MGAVKMFEPYDLGPTVEATAFALTALSTLVVTARCYCRIWIVGKLKLYDFIMFAALLLTWGLCVVNHYQLYFGSGEHRRPKNVPQATDAEIHVRLVGSARSWYAYQIMYMADLALIKFSILAFYLTIASDGRFRIMVHICTSVVAIFSVVMIFINAFQCPSAPSLALSPEIFSNRASGRCFDLAPVYYAQAGFNIVSDTVILGLPLPLLTRLRMPTLKRICLLAVFSAGLLIPISSCIRLWGLYLWDKNGALSRYYGAYVIFWSQVEINTAIICASMPSLQPLFRCVFKELSSLRRPRHTYYFYGEERHATPPAPLTAEEIEADQQRDKGDLLTTPPPTFRPQKAKSVNGSRDDLILVKDMDEDEQIRNRVRAFMSHRSSTQSHPPKSPARPRDLLSSG